MVQKNGIVALVATEKALYSYDNLFTYAIPENITEDLIGKRVIIPFGRGNKKQLGVVFDIKKESYDPTVIKSIYSVIDEEPISKELLQLVKWLKENTFCTFYDGIRTILPPGFGINLSSKIEINKNGFSEPLSNKEESFFSLLNSAKSKQELDMYLDCSLDKEKENVINSLLKKRALINTSTAKKKISDETELMVRLSDNFEELILECNLTPKQKLVVEALINVEFASIKEVCYICNITVHVINTLVNKNVLEKYEYEVSRAVSKDAIATENPENIVFSSAQQKVYDGLLELMNKTEPQCALLRGVTGSGKTSVFIKLIENALSSGKSAIMLVPEISLTPQTVRNFQSIFGNKVAIIHSGLSLGQRNDEYKRIKSGEARIVIGTRSAVFAPVTNIGIIVIDEEGEHSYKSEKNPRYHARDIAKQRAFANNSLLLLASATPSIGSYFNAKIRKYNLFELEERYSSAVLPDVYIVDMKIEAETGNRGNFSEVLLSEIRSNLEKGEQSMLLLNRRGYHTYINCISCGTVVECPNCNIPLTYHKTNNTVICHYCGYIKPLLDKCEKCGSKYIHQSGTGTQRIEEEISSYFPNARILRMDADTTMSKHSYEKNFSEFGKGNYDIMVGTQMIAKGLDFENVTLVGVLNIDKSLYAGDFMGYEKTFSLVTQVVGRAGRGRKKGRAYIQSFSPEHYVLELAAEQNYVEFYNQEIEVRKALIFPPFCDICLIGFSSLVDSACLSASNRFLEIIKELLIEDGNKLPVIVLGPTKTGTGKLNGKFRYKLVLKCKNTKTFRQMINKAVFKAYSDKNFSNVSFYIDINGEII